MRNPSLDASLRWFGIGWCGLAAFVPATALPAIPDPDTLFEPEIVITARKIEEDPQEIPMSVQVLSGELLDELDLTRLYELQFSTPGLVMNNAGLWGAGMALRGVSEQSPTGTGVAPHLNGVYLDSSNSAITRMFDLDRVELLKGPQSSLYGRNSTGGAINFVTRAPEDQFSAAFEGAYGSFSSTRAQGHVNAPIGSAAARLAFTVSEGDGYIRNTVDSRRFGESDYWGVRGSLSAAVGDALHVNLVAQRVRDDGASGELWTQHPDFLPDPADIRRTTVTLADPYLVNEDDNTSIRLEYALPFGTLRSITGYAKNETRNRDDCAGLPFLANCVRGGRPIEHEQWSQEIQLHVAGTGRVDTLLGLHYYDADGVSNFYEFIPNAGPGFRTNSHTTSREQSIALFAQTTLQLIDRWSVTGGVRWSDDELHVDTIGTGFADSPTLVAGGQEADHVAWRADLKYAASDDRFWYAGIATGYRSGGLSRSGDHLESFDPENLTAYEAGLKSRWLNQRLTFNAAAFLYDFEDLQVVSITTGPGANTIDNAAKAEIQGVDASLTWQVAPRLTIETGAVWLAKREFEEFVVDAVDLSGNELMRAPPWTATAALSHVQPIGALGRLTGRIEYAYRGASYFSKENSPAFSQHAFGLMNLYLTLEPAGGRWYAFASARNVTNEDYFHQVFFQSNPGYPVNYEAGCGVRF
jgi:iron complex outermembrane receptor protein